jgi:hypothetical protein
VVGFVLIFAPADRNGGAVAQSGTMRAPDSSGPIVTSVMIAAGVSQLLARLGLSHGGRDGPVHLPGDVAGKGEWRAMMAHELLRQAAQILGAGWSNIADARDDTGRIVPLHAGANRAQINPTGVRKLVQRSGRPR